ncbi:MAG: aminotransferase class I/II-fold pyridoxal phosphate-dependent enzyme [Phycisphaeraceae bacterium]|nr:aminotransferase class I/II-fold pyridoxal phosphate-dependent enzyme [Phycisphaeraceae bacterium]
MFDADRFISQRARQIDASGIRRVFDLAASLKDPVNLSIGQPDFDVPQPILESAIEAMRRGMNRYTVTQGIEQLRHEIEASFTARFPDWKPASNEADADGFSTLITSGVSGGLVLALLATVGPGDEVIMPDPYFVMYKHLVTLAGATPVMVDTYPDFELTALRVESAITPRTKLVLFNSPSNPTGVVSPAETCRALARLCEDAGVLLVSDEIYSEFCYLPEGLPSPASFGRNLLVLRGFSKTYGMTGWRLGYAVGPAPVLAQMTKLQQYTFVCAPSMVQFAGIEALKTDMGVQIDHYRAKRDRVVERLSGVYPLVPPAGAFYAFPKVPEALGLSATAFVERAISEHKLLVIPGAVFSDRDTHLRLSYACDDAMLERGLDALLALAGARTERAGSSR